jgi:histidinol dehydrogenase
VTLRWTLDVMRSDSRAGRRAVERLIRRGETVLDAATLRRAGKIVADVRRRGDRALVEYARKLDGADLKKGADSAAGLALAPLPENSTDALPAGFAEALERAIVAVERFHAPQARSGYRLDDEDGVELEELVTPLRRIGVYVPGGRAAYPSTVVMTVVPARVAGVRDIAVATPPGSYRAHVALRYTLERLGIEEVWGMGGAHAVAALAYGTETIRRVDKIVGPGNAWVTAAKKLVFGDVAVDGIAGPSEVVIVADETANAGDIAADLLAQAEHDPRAAAVLLATDAKLAKRVAREIEKQLESLSTAATARASLQAFGAALIVPSLEEAARLVDRIAPEHLQLVGPLAEALAGQIGEERLAGAVFLGPSTPEVFGDYIAGPSHVLPTCGSARFASSLGVEDFLRRSHRLRFSRTAASRRAAAAATLADAEGLPAHAAAARRRLG